MKKTIFFTSLLFLLFVKQAYSETENMSRNDEARFGLSASLVNVGRYQEAIPILEELYLRYPENKDASLLLAKAKGYSGDIKGSADILKSLSAKYPRDQEVLSVYANILESNGELSRARQEYLNALKNSPGNEDILRKLADTSLWLGDYSAAKDYLEALFLKHPGDKQLQLQLADVYFGARDYDKAIGLYERLQIEPRKNEQSYKKFSKAYALTGNYGKALDNYEEFLKAYPGDLGTKIDKIQALRKLGKIDKAQVYLNKIIRENYGNIQALISLAEFFAQRRNFEQAVKMCGIILSKEPDNKEGLLWMARILSWQGSGRKSLEIYDKLIAAYPDWVLAYREKARVLGWMGDFSSSLEQYQKAMSIDGANAALTAEASAKKNFYRIYDRGAIKEYNRWLAAEPDNFEALFDLAQVYSRQMQWENASRMYNKVLLMAPEHVLAAKALTKTELYSNAWFIDGGFQWYEADSSSRHNDERYYNVQLSATTPLREDAYLTFREDNFSYLFSEPSQVNRQQLSLALDYYRKPYFWTKLEYSYSFYSDNFKSGHNDREEINFSPVDPLIFTLSHAREDVMDNGQTLKNNLKRDNYGFAGLLNINRRLAFSAAYIYSDYNDGNRKKTFDLRGDYFFSYDPHSFKIFYEYQAYGFDKPSDYYFAPSSFHFDAFGLEWRHFLNKEELFWGMNNFYYTLRYMINFDSGDQTGHTLYADIHRDWNDKFSTHLELYKKIYEHRETYSEDRVTLSFRRYF
ncbi:MAG: tetratricopeptide repeat protein [Candidatus Omnitrophica bacterium]|nr:tetratricopeptide repeat protein [Candidatus Omnitrophota bacterium]